MSIVNEMLKLDIPPNPCYNPKTRTDCPDRCAGCARTCEKWAEYEKARAAVYENRRINYEAEQMRHVQIIHKREKAALKKQLRYRRVKKKLI